MARMVEVKVRTVVQSLPAEMVERINDDGTITCRDCGNRLPPEENLRLRKFKILWSHQGIPCRATEGWLSH